MYGDYLAIFDSSLYKHIGDDKTKLRRCRQISKDTIFLIEHTTKTHLIDFLIIKSTSIDNINKQKYEEGFCVADIQLMTEKQKKLLIAIDKYADTATAKDYDTIIKEIKELKDQIY